MASKVRGDGGIYPLEDKPRNKCRKWKLVVSLGRDPRTGKYPQKSRTFSGTYTEAKAARREFVAEIESGDVVRRSSWTFASYAEHFCEVREKTRELAPQTIYADRSYARQISHLIGHVRLQDVTPTVLEKAYLDLRSGMSLSGRPLRGTTLSNIHGFVSSMMRHAKRAGIVAENPCEGVDAPKRDTAEKRALSEKELGELVAKLDPADSCQCAVLLAGSLGLRRGELCGLSCGDVDFDAMTLVVRHSYDRFGNLKEPKTEAGSRALPLSPFAALVLSVRMQALVELYGAEDGYTVTRTVRGKEVVMPAPDRPLLTAASGRRLSTSSLSVWWARHRERLGVGRLTLHELRHTFLSVAAGRGVHPSAMQKLAGHRDPSVTLRIYTHVNMETQRAAMDAIAGAFDVSTLTAA